MSRRLVRMSPLGGTRLEPKGSKYGNVRCIGPAPDGGQRTYDSLKEARYAVELVARQRAGEIVSWKAQERIKLTVDGVPLIPHGSARQSVYVADFLIQHVDGRTQVVDVKGYINDANPTTRLWRLKLGILQRMWPQVVITTDEGRRR